MNSPSCLRERQSLRHAFTPVTKPEGSRETDWRSLAEHHHAVRGIPHTTFTQQSWLFLNALETVTVRRMSDTVASGSHSVHSNPFRERIVGMDNERTGLSLSGSGRSHTILLTQRPCILFHVFRAWMSDPLISDMTAHQTVANHRNPRDFWAGFWAG